MDSGLRPVPTTATLLLFALDALAGAGAIAEIRAEDDGVSADESAQSHRRSG